jgi:hypothetical protein
MNQQEPPQLQGDDTQWEITFTDPDEPDETEIQSGFRRAWAIAVSPARIEQGDWDYTERDAVWALFHDPAVQSAIIASHPDGRQVKFRRL